MNEPGSDHAPGDRTQRRWEYLFSRIALGEATVEERAEHDAWVADFLRAERRSIYPRWLRWLPWLK